MARQFKAWAAPAAWGRVGVVAALPEEAAVLARRRLPRGGQAEAGLNLRVLVSGAGRDNALRAAETLLAGGVECLLSWGCAAGLSPEARPGDLALAARVRSAAGDVYAADPGMRQWLLRQLPPGARVLDGDLLESLHLVAAGAEKQALHRASGAAALDMESAAVFEAAARAGVPCLAVRAVADPVDLTLPPAVAAALNADGMVEPSILLKQLFRYPGQIPALISLGLNFNAAVSALKQAAAGMARADAA